MNQDLLANPFDEELRSVTRPFGALLRAIVTTVDKFGLKRWHLQKHAREVEHSFQQLSEQVFDQHALHERILYEQFQQRLRTGTLEVQRLLIPEPIALSPAHAAVVLEQRDALAELGLLVEDFGGSTVLLTGYPALLARRPAREVFQAVVDQLVSKERLPSREQLLNDLLSLLACHAAVRAGDRLTQGEIASLLAQRQLVRDSHHCPHGRPTATGFSRRDLEKLFKRV